MKRIRIVHVLYRMGAGGTELALQRLAAGLDPERFENIICTVAPSPEGEPCAGARYISMKRGGPKTGFLFPDFTRLFLRERPDVVHSRNWGAIEAVAAARLARVPRVIHSEHGRNIHTMGGDPWRRLIFRRLCYALADEVFAVSRELREHHARQLALPEARLKVIPNGVDANRFRPDARVRGLMRGQLGVTDDVLVLGTVGRLDPVKDQGLLLRAAEQLIRAGMRLHVVIAGDGPESQNLRAQVSASHVLYGRVTLAGEAARPEDWMNSFDVFALPSLSEGMSNTLLEAMATGLPCVATRVGGNPDLVDDLRTGFLVNSGDASGLADRIMKLAGEPELRSAFGARGRQKVESQFSLRQMVENYTRLYAAPLSRGPLKREPLSREPWRPEPEPESATQVAWERDGEGLRTTKVRQGKSADSQEKDQWQLRE